MGGKGNKKPKIGFLSFVYYLSRFNEDILLKWYNLSMSCYIQEKSLNSEKGREHELAFYRLFFDEAKPPYQANSNDEFQEQLLKVQFIKNIANDVSNKFNLKKSRARYFIACFCMIAVLTPCFISCLIFTPISSVFIALSIVLAALLIIAAVFLTRNYRNLHDYFLNKIPTSYPAANQNFIIPSNKLEPYNGQICNYKKQKSNTEVQTNTSSCSIGSKIFNLFKNN